MTKISHIESRSEMESKKPANKYYKKHETEFQPTQDQFDNIGVPILTELHKHVSSHQAKFVTVSGINYCKFMFVCDNVVGTYLLNACREKGYVLKHKFVSDSIKVKRTKLTPKGENLIEKSNRGLIVLTREEILAEPGTQTSCQEVVNYLDPRKWSMSLSLPLAQCDYWQPWLISVLSVKPVPELSEEDKAKFAKQMAAVNKRIDSQEQVTAKKKSTKPKQHDSKKSVTKILRIKKRGEVTD